MLNLLGGLAEARSEANALLRQLRFGSEEEEDAAAKLLAKVQAGDAALVLEEYSRVQPATPTDDSPQHLELRDQLREHATVSITELLAKEEDNMLGGGPTARGQILGSNRGGNVFPGGVLSSANAAAGSAAFHASAQADFLARLEALIAQAKAVGGTEQNSPVLPEAEERLWLGVTTN